MRSAASIKRSLGADSHKHGRAAERPCRSDRVDVRRGFAAAERSTTLHLDHGSRFFCGVDEAAGPRIKSGVTVVFEDWVL